MFLSDDVANDLDVAGWVDIRLADRERVWIVLGYRVCKIVSRQDPKHETIIA